MKEQYYYPDISEFHEGLRCEMRNPWGRLEKDKEWKPYVFTFNTYDDMPHEYDEGYEVYRVKYLDREDIEELGWEFNSNVITYLLFFITVESETYQLTFSPEYTQITHKTGVATSDRLFKGQIKNFNALRTLMNQIGIL